tara:strand:- start:2088 stop:2276 length:189 start_codon:yes stop_codon:yes gene_type:complete
MGKCKGKTGRSLEMCKEQQSFVKGLKKRDSLFNVKETMIKAKISRYKDKKVRTSTPLASTQF